jgi:hypothetical protein
MAGKVRLDESRTKESRKEHAMNKICRLFLILFLVFTLNGCSDDDDSATVSGSGNAPVAENAQPEYDQKETYSSYGTRNGGRQAWRIPRKGPDFGKKIKVVFSDGHTVYVNNTSRNYRESDGFVFKPGIGPNGEGVNNTGTAHGGVYLHAPYGNRSKRVTFHFHR